MAQIPLPISLPTGATFGNFVVGRNAEAVHAVRGLGRCSTQRFIVLTGRRGTGKTHLLEAACGQTLGSGEPVVYLPLAQAGGLGAEVLDGLESMALVCIDDIDAIAGAPDWERALFDLYNRVEASGACLLVSASRKVAECGIGLADLRSRLAAGTAFRLRALGEEDLKRALRLRAREQGFEIPDAVATFLIHRQPRDMHAAMRWLEELARSTLIEKRRVTIPLARKLLGEQANEGSS